MRLPLRGRATVDFLSKGEKTMSFQWKMEKTGARLYAGDALICMIPARENCCDSLEEIGEGAWKWVRKTAAPVTEMKMTLQSAAPLTYWQVPSVNYNGNGWGSGAQYSGFGCDGTPWTYAWHRVAVPACTYSEQGPWGVSLFGEEKGGMSCSIWEEDGCARQALLWPEVEGPKCLSKRCWLEPFQGSMEPADTFTGIIYVCSVEKAGKGYGKMLDFAWKLFERPVMMDWQPEELAKLDTTFFRTMYQARHDGLVGYSMCMHWDERRAQFIRKEEMQIGWVGQNASLSCTLLREYVKTGDEDLRGKAISALDSWVKHASLPNGLFFVSLIAPPDHLDSVDNGTIPTELDACNLGTGALYLLKAGPLAEKAGVPRPEYTKMGLAFCDFAIRAQKENGEFAKSYFIDGSIDNPHGSVGAFMILPLFEAWKQTGKQEYLDCALKGFQFYNGEFQQNGFTTAGALDSYCIDKESAAPLLRAALQAYHATEDWKYVEAAEDIAHYLDTWTWHYSIEFDEGSPARMLGYDAYGGTSVSAAHNALDPYAVYYVPEYLELAKLTGKEIYRSRGRAMWYNGIQRISDGSLVIEGRVRPYGSQDESVRHTRWGRTDRRYHVTSGNLVCWMGAFRQVALSLIEDWDQLR